MAAEIRLALGLDLAYFRQEMRKAINIVQSEFTGQINVKINRQSLQRESQYLANYFRRKNYRINVNTNLDAEILKAKNLTQKLNKINGRKVPVSIQSAITNADVEQFRRDVQSKLGGIKVKIEAELGQASRSGFAAGPAGAAGLYEYMRSQGLSGGNMPGAGGAVGVGRSERLRKALEDLSVKQLQALAKESGIAGVSRLRKDPLISRLVSDLNQDIAENILGNIKNQMRGEGGKIQRSFLDQIARAVMFMAGVDPEQLRREAARRRLPPAIDFPATVPSRTIPIGPSATGRALTGVTQGALPGRSIANAKYLPSDLGVELKRILRGAAYAFIDSLNERVRQVRVREIGQAQLAPSRVAGLLPSAVGRQAARYGGPGDVRGRRIAEAYARSAARGASVMAEGPQGFALGAGGSGPAGPFRPFAQPPRGGAIVPYNAAMAGGPSTQLPPGYFAGGKLQQALKGADQYLKQSRVPLTGAIQELGSEFGNAVKQVLLFGTAYKALAFIINLPNQALAAATSLQTFNNQLLAVTGSAGAANQAFSFIDGLAERFNVPLESARQGFVRLYASMEPAGFAPEQIEGLFTGISKAAATFGLSADQVDRVTYAFSQMASKGQAMSEELKGQLGDVLPGSLALFARAAQMSIPEFTKALEDGAFKGEAFQALLRNVAKLMNTEFAGGAAGAADTLQGRMNDLSNSVTKMYESFEPLVGLISAQVFPQLSGIIGDATEAIQAFVGGIQGAEDPAAQLSSRGLAIYEALRQVADIGQSLQGIISALAPTFGVFSKAVLSVVQNIAKLLDTGVGQWLAKLAVQTALVTAALQLMAKAGLIAAIRGLVLFVTNVKGAIAKLKVFIATSRIAKIALGGLIVGTVLVFFEAMASKVDQANNKLRNTAKFARDLKAELDSLAAAGDVAATTAKYTAAEQKIASLDRSIELLEGARRLGGRETTPQEFERLQRSGLSSGMSLTRNLLTGKTYLTGRAGNIEANIQAAREAKNRAAIESGEARDAMESAANVRRAQQAQQTSLETIDLSAEGEGKGKGTKGAKERVDMSNQELAIKQKIRQQEAGIEQGLKGYNQLKLIQLNLELELLRIRESDMLMNQKYDAMQEAQRKADSERTAVFKDMSKAIYEGIEEAEQQEERRRNLAIDYRDLINEVRLANGEITEKEYEQNQALAERERIIKRIYEMVGGGAITPEQGQAAVQQVEAAALPGTFEAAIRDLRRELDQLTSVQTVVIESAQGIGDAFGTSFNNIVTGASSAKESLADFFSNVGKMFADMATRIISQWVAMKTIGLVGSLLPGGAAPALRSSGGATMTAGQATQAGFGMGASLAKGFATGGVVTGPTLGLIGEGRFNEAVVPLPNGKSIPVDLGGGTGGDIATSIVVNVNNGQASSSMKGNQGNQLAKNIEGAVKELIMRETRPGGIIYSSRQ